MSKILLANTQLFKTAVPILVVVLILLSFSVPARADVAPPEQPPGANPGPGSETTQVRMLDEVVIIDVLAEEPARAHVTANFTMRNLGGQAENMDVRFPLGSQSVYFDINEVQNISVRVSDKVVTHQRMMQETEVYGQKTQAPWAVFPVAFPPGENVLIKVSYDVTGTGWEYDNFVKFTYILETGAGWKDTIGSATIILRLPYDINDQNVLNLNKEPSLSGIEGRDVAWSFTDLEPTFEDNFEVYIVKPVIWKRVRDERENVRKNPQDGEAWGRLGKAYKQSFVYPKWFCREDGASAELYTLSKEAYEKAVSLKPEDALWHAGFADLLVYSGQWGCPDLPNDRIRALQEIQTALQLDPNDEKVQEIAAIISFLMPDGIVKTDTGYDYPWLTQTPTPTLVLAPPATPEPGATLPAVPSPQPPAPLPATPGPTARNPLIPPCGAALILPLLAAGLVLLRRR